MHGYGKKWLSLKSCIYVNYHTHLDTCGSVRRKRRKISITIRDRNCTHNQRKENKSIEPRPNKYSRLLPKYAKITGNEEKPIKNILTRAHNISITYHSTKKDRGRKKAFTDIQTNHWGLRHITDCMVFRFVFECLRTVRLLLFIINAFYAYAGSMQAKRTHIRTYLWCLLLCNNIRIFLSSTICGRASCVYVCVCARSRDSSNTQYNLSKKQRRTANL